MIGTLINPKMIAPFRTVIPMGAPKICMINWFMMVRPMKPHTTDGIAARSSITIFSVSLSLGEQNSEMKSAEPKPNGTAISMESIETLTVPAIRANTP